MTTPGHDSAARLESTRRMWLSRRERLLTAFARATERRRTIQMHRVCRDLRRLNELLDTLDQVQATLRITTPGAARYTVSSLFLHECYRELTADQHEQFFFVTGSEVDGDMVLDQKLAFAHQRRTMMGVEGQVGSTHRLLIKLEQFGHRLLAHFHSHPGRGLASTGPSGTDEQFQRRLERAGYPTIAAIFSRDGFVRFFRLEGEFELHVHGAGVEDLGQHMYRLTAIDSLARQGDSGSH